MMRKVLIRRTLVLPPGGGFGRMSFQDGLNYFVAGNYVWEIDIFEQKEECCYVRVRFRVDKK